VVNTPVLEVEGLSAAYGKRQVLRELTFSAREGELWAILGPNGAGKSTLLRVCLGLHKPLSGRVAVLGKPLGQWTRRALAQEVSWVPQSFDWASGFTGLELVLMGRSPRLGLWGLPSKGDVKRALSLMEELEVSHLASRPAHAISGGEQRLLLLCRALIQEPKIVMLDEPTAFLDLRHQMEVLTKIRLRVARGLAALAVVHDVNQAVACADKVLLLKAGRVLATGDARSTVDEERLRELYEIEIVSADAEDGQRLFAPSFRI
jgi:iron complex transport system ATP-binding protein